MNKKILITFILMSLQISVVADDALFKKVFGKRLQSKVISLPIIFKNTPLGDVDFHILGDKFTHLDSEQLVFALSKVASKSLLKNILVNKKLKKEELPKGLSLKLNIGKLYVSLELEPKYYRVSRRVYENFPDIYGKKIYHPAKYSHILNYWLRYDDLRLSSEVINLDLESVLNINGIVLENTFDITTQESRETTNRTRTTLIKDFKSSQVRTQLGDIRFSTTNLQEQLNLLGLSVAKDYSLDPYQKITPLNRFEFLLAQRSYVTIYVNDRPVRSEILDKGKHSIEDLVLDYGRSNITIRAKQLGGSEVEYNFSWAGNSDLLRAGLSQYSFNVGVESKQDDLAIKYQDDLIFSGFYKYGVNNTFTIGGSTQLGSINMNLGPSFIMATDLGNIRLESSLSKEKATESKGVASELEYEFNFKNLSIDLTSSFAYLYQSPRYASFNQSVGNNEFLNTFRYNINWYFNYYVNFGASISKSINRYGLSDKDIYRLSMGFRPNRNLRIATNVERRVVSSGDIDHRAMVFLTYNFANGGHYLSTNYNTQLSRKRVSLNYLPTERQDTFYYRADVEDDDLISSVEVTTGFRSRYFDSEASVKQYSDKESDYRLKVSGALVWSPGSLMLSQSVYDSFSYIRGKNSLDEKKLGVLNDIGGLGSKEYRNTLHMPKLSSYRYHQVLMDPTHLTVGSSYDYDRFYIYPSYRSVVPVTLGKVRSYSVFGSIDYSNSALAYGEVTSENGKSVPFFTNRKGAFAIESIPEGKYEVWINGKLLESRINLTKDSPALVNLGRIK